MDFIKKPFVPEVLTLRVRHIIELIRLQRNLSQEVEKKTEENEKLFVHVVRSLAEAIDQRIPIPMVIPEGWQSIHGKLREGMDILRKRRVISI